MVNQFRTLLEKTKFTQPAVTPVDIEVLETDEGEEVRYYPRLKLSARWIEFLTGFSETLGTLKEIAHKQLNRDTLSAVETRFLRDMAEVNERKARSSMVDLCSAIMNSGQPEPSAQANLNGHNALKTNSFHQLRNG